MEDKLTVQKIILSQVKKGNAIAYKSELSASGFFVTLTKDATDEQKNTALPTTELSQKLGVENEE